MTLDASLIVVGAQSGRRSFWSACHALTGVSNGITSSSCSSRIGDDRNSTRCATTSTASRRRPSCSQVRVFSRPTTPTRCPFARYSEQSSPCRSQAETQTKSAPASRAPRLTASKKLATFFCSSPTSRSSTSVARLPIRFTLFMEPKVDAQQSGKSQAFVPEVRQRERQRTSTRLESGHGPLFLDDRVRRPRYGG